MFRMYVIQLNSKYCGCFQLARPIYIIILCHITISSTWLMLYPGLLVISLRQLWVSWICWLYIAVVYVCESSASCKWLSGFNYMGDVYFEITLQRW